MKTKIMNISLEDSDVTTVEFDFTDALDTSGEGLVSIEADSDFLQMQEAEADGNESIKSVIEETQASTALEAIASYLGNEIATEGYDIHTLHMTNVAVESICNKVDFKSTSVAFSLESYKADPKAELTAAMEGIKARASALWASVKDKIATVAKYLGEKLNYFKRNLAKLMARTTRLENMLSKADDSKGPKVVLLKPQSWFIDLMYTDGGMPKGMVGVGKDVESLLKSHTRMATDSFNKYSKWLTTHYKEAETNIRTFDTLRVSKNDFLVFNSTEFNRSIGKRIPHDDNMFYRSPELPGGMAFYTEIRPNDTNGTKGISTLNDADFFIDKFDPQSYKIQRKILAEFSATSSFAWAAGSFLTVGTGLGALSAILAVGWGVNAFYQNNKAKIESTGKKFTIPKEMRFNTLTLAEAKKSLADVRLGIKALQEWYKAVFEANWTGGEIDKVINGIIGLDRVEVSTNPSFRALKRYCTALLNLMYSLTSNTHSYAFKTYNSMLNYTERSLRQYV
jgi:hypothetical protein